MLKKTPRSPAISAYKSTAHFRKRIRQSISIKARTHISAKGCITARGQERAGASFSCLPPEKAVAGGTCSLRAGTTDVFTAHPGARELLILLCAGKCIFTMGPVPVTEIWGGLNKPSCINLTVINKQC